MNNHQSIIIIIGTKEIRLVEKSYTLEIHKWQAIRGVLMVADLGNLHEILGLNLITTNVPKKKNDGWCLVLSF